MPPVPPRRVGATSSSTSSLGSHNSMAVPIRKAAPGVRAGTGAKTANDEGYLYLAGVRDPSKRITEFRTDHDICPICHTDRQFNKNLRLLVSPCYHKMCESCIDRLFTLGPEPCPTCGKILRKVNFAHQTFEDLKVEKEVAVRRRMAEHFNKREEDFGSSKEYDDYLEEVEELTFNLLNEIDVEKTEKRISEYTRSNAKLIALNQEKAALESLTQHERDEIEKRQREERIRMIEDAEKLEKMEDERIKVEIIDALARGDRISAESLRSEYESGKILRAETLSRSLPGGNNLLGQEEEDSTIHTPLSPRYHGPFVPIPYNDIEKADWSRGYTMKEDYVDGRSGVILAKEDKQGKIKPGGWDLSLFWEMEIRSAVEGLGIEPLKD